MQRFASVFSLGQRFFTAKALLLAKAGVRLVAAVLSVSVSFRFSFSLVSALGCAMAKQQCLISIDAAPFIKTESQWGGRCAKVLAIEGRPFM